MGRPGMAGKQKNPATQGGSCRGLRWPDSGSFGGDWPGNFTDKITSLHSSSLAAACARVVAGDASHVQNSFGLQMGQNDPIRCSRFLGVFSRVLDLKMSVLGLGFSLARKTMFI